MTGLARDGLRPRGNLDDAASSITAGELAKAMLDHEETPANAMKALRPAVHDQDTEEPL